MANNLDINLNEQFDTLENAPIVEAIIHWQAAATTDFFDTDYLASLKVSFTDYDVGPQHSLTTGIQGTEQGLAINHSNVVQGARLTKSAGGKPEFVCQFLRNGIIFSKLAPYKDWGSFLNEAQKFWQHYQQVAKPVDASSIAVRYISQVPVSSALDSSKYIGSNCAPLSALGLNANSFYHQDTILLDNQPYGINVGRSVQTSPDGKSQLIVDISAFTSTPLTNLDNADSHLAELRYLKNKVFFSIMVDPTTSFGGEANV